MGKGRRTANKSHGGAEGIAASSTSNGSPFSAFDFNDDDMLVEVEERKTIAKYGKIPGNKPARRRKSIDKYDFLQCFAQEATSKQMNFENDDLVAGPTYCVSQDRTMETDVGMSAGLFSYESAPFSSVEYQSSECTSGVKSSLARRRKPGCDTAGKKHNQVLHLDSDDDEILESATLGSPINIEENEGSLKEQSSEFGANSTNCEAMVVLAPHYVKHGNNYYINCRLIFSQRFIRLEAAPLCDRNRTHFVEWPTSDLLDIKHQQCESDKAEVIILYLRYEVANADETGTVEVEFVICDDPQWSEKQEEIRSLDLKYGASWKTIVTPLQYEKPPRCLLLGMKAKRLAICHLTDPESKEYECCFEESFEEVVYPDGDPDAVIISRRDIELLRPRTFINDTIIDFYIRYLFNKTKAEKQHRFHFFNTFFYQKLVAVKQESSKSCGGRGAFQSVLKWTRNVNLFEKDYIFIPVNFSLHWSLIIICHPGEVAYLRNKDMDDSSKVPCILHMDSLRGMHEGCQILIRSYLWQEWKERENEQGNEMAEKFSCLDFVPLQVPQQENLFDCGLFLLHYAELFLELALNCSTTISIDFFNEGRWFLPAEVSLKKRAHIKKLIHKLSQDNAGKDPPASSINKYLKKHGRRVAESSSRSVLKNSAKELCGGINLDLVDTPRQQCYAPLLKQRNNTKEWDQPRSLRVPINLFNNLNLPLEEASGKQTTVAQRDIISECNTDEVMRPSQLNCFLAGEASRSCSDESAVTPLAATSEEHCASEVGFPIEMQKQREEDSSMESHEDLAACVVEDSEDETPVYSVRRTTRRRFPN